MGPAVQADNRICDIVIGKIEMPAGDAAIWLSWGGQQMTDVDDNKEDNITDEN